MKSFKTVLFVELLFLALLSACTPEGTPTGGSSSATSSALSSASSVSSSSARSSVSSTTSSSASAGKVTLSWEHPKEREDGTYLELQEIGGYSIKTHLLNNSFYTYYQVPGNTVLSYVIENYTPETVIEIAVYDTTGLYSVYVEAQKIP